MAVWIRWTVTVERNASVEWSGLERNGMAQCERGQTISIDAKAL